MHLDPSLKLPESSAAPAPGPFTLPPPWQPHLAGHAPVPHAAPPAAAACAPEPQGPAPDLPAALHGQLLPVMAPQTRAVALLSPAAWVFHSHDDALGAVDSLGRAGFDVKKLSLVGKGYQSEEHPVGFYTAGDRIRAWGGLGAFWGGIWGLLLAPAVFFLPGVGLVAMAGPLVAGLVGALEGAVLVGGLSALGAAFMRLGASREDAIRYETALRFDQYVLMVHGDAATADHARELLVRMQSQRTQEGLA